MHTTAKYVSISISVLLSLDLANLAAPWISTCAMYEDIHTRIYARAELNILFRFFIGVINIDVNFMHNTLIEYQILILVVFVCARLVNGRIAHACHESGRSIHLVTIPLF